jgi:hypothetical protein
MLVSLGPSPIRVVRLHPRAAYRVAGAFGAGVGSARGTARTTQAGVRCCRATGGRRPVFRQSPECSSTRPSSLRSLHRGEPDAPF